MQRYKNFLTIQINLTKICKVFYKVLKIKIINLQENSKIFIFILLYYYSIFILYYYTILLK